VASANAVRTRDLGRLIELALRLNPDELSIAEISRRSGLTERKISGIVRQPPEYETTSLATCDRILVALDRVEWLMNGTLELIEDGRGRANRLRAAQLKAAA